MIRKLLGILLATIIIIAAGFAVLGAYLDSKDDCFEEDQICITD